MKIADWLVCDSRLISPLVKAVTHFLCVVLLTAPSVTQAFIDLTDIGLINAEAAPLTLIVECNNGRKIDIHLERAGSLITRRVFGEHIVKITLPRKGAPPRVYDLAQLRQRAGKKQNEWLYIHGPGTRIISSEEKRLLERHQ